MKAGHYDEVLAQGRRGTFRLILMGGAAAAVLVIAVTALVIWTSPGPGTGAADKVTSPAASADATVPGSELLATPGLDVEMPDDLVWQDLQGVMLPYSVSKGPADTLGGRARGFAHDPAGAVLAAAHIIVRINPQVGPNVFEPTLREQVVGPNVPALRDTIIRAYATLRQQAGVPYGDPVGYVPAILLGFRVDSYTDLEAEVRLITQGTDGRGGTTTAALRLYVQWSGDDWVLAFPADADPTTTNIAVDENSLYTPFGGR